MIVLLVSQLLFINICLLCSGGGRPERHRYQRIWLGSRQAVSFLSFGFLSFFWEWQKFGVRLSVNGFVTKKKTTTTCEYFILSWGLFTLGSVWIDLNTREVSTVWSDSANHCSKTAELSEHDCPCKSTGCTGHPLNSTFKMIAWCWWWLLWRGFSSEADTHTNVRTQLDYLAVESCWFTSSYPIWCIWLLLDYRFLVLHLKPFCSSSEQTGG